MAANMVSLRLPGELVEWAAVYSKERGVSRTDLLVEAIRTFKADCEGGVPEIRPKPVSAVPRGVDAGVGDCPRRGEGLGHVWRSWREDPVKPCKFCGLAGRGPGGHLESALRERTDVFSRLVGASMESGTGNPEKAHPKGLTAEQEATAARIVEDKRRRDREAVEAGTARPGQVAGVEAAKRRERAG